MKIFPYNPKWPAMFERESKSISRILGDHCIDIHHIGSTSVTGISAKENIDIMCVVDSLKNSLNLRGLDYVFKGELNIPMRYYFVKSTAELKVNLHVVPANHGFIELNLCFRNYLRNNEKTRLAYQNLKYTLAKDPSSFERQNNSLPKYTLEKDAFIKSTLKEANYDGRTINFCTHYNEWKSYHRLKEQLLFKPLGIEYDQNHPTVLSENHHHLVLYKGVDIVSIAQVEILDDAIAVLRSLATDTPYQRRGYGAYFLSFLERWLHFKGIKTIKVHAETIAENFYRKLGYVDVEFNDISISKTTTKLGKAL